MPTGSAPSRRGRLDGAASAFEAVMLVRSPRRWRANPKGSRHRRSAGPVRPNGSRGCPRLPRVGGVLGRSVAGPAGSRQGWGRERRRAVAAGWSGLRPEVEAWGERGGVAGQRGCAGPRGRGAWRRCRGRWGLAARGRSARRAVLVPAGPRPQGAGAMFRQALFSPGIEAVVEFTRYALEDAWAQELLGSRRLSVRSLRRPEVPRRGWPPRASGPVMLGASMSIMKRSSRLWNRWAPWSESAGSHWPRLIPSRPCSVGTRRGRPRAGVA